MFASSVGRVATVRVLLNYFQARRSDDGVETSDNEKAEAQESGLAVALHADPIGQLPGFLGGRPEEQVLVRRARARDLHVLAARGRDAVDFVLARGVESAPL